MKLTLELFTKSYLDYCRLLWYSVVLQGGARMKGTLEELWHGNVSPQTDSRNNTLDMKQLMEYMARWRKRQKRLMTMEFLTL